MEQALSLISQIYLIEDASINKYLECIVRVYNRNL